MMRIQVKLLKKFNRVIAIINLWDIIKMECSQHKINPHIINFLAMYDILDQRNGFDEK